MIVCVNWLCLPCFAKKKKKKKEEWGKKKKHTHTRTKFVETLTYLVVVLYYSLLPVNLPIVGLLRDSETVNGWLCAMLQGSFVLGGMCAVGDCSAYVRECHFVDGRFFWLLVTGCECKCRVWLSFQCMAVHRKLHHTTNVFVQQCDWMA